MRLGIIRSAGNILQFMVVRRMTEKPRSGKLVWFRCRRDMTRVSIWGTTMGANEILEKILGWANRVLPEEDNNLHAGMPRFRRPKSVLIIPSKFIGDNVLLIPFIRNLRRNLGEETRLDIMTTPTVQPLYETLPWLDEVHVEKRHWPANARQFLETQGYDTIFFTRYSLHWGNAARRANIPQRVGFDLERIGIHRLKRWGHCLTHTIPSTPIFDTRPQVDLYLDTLRLLKFDVKDSHLECHLQPEDYSRARHLLQQAGHAPCVLIQAASGSPGKEWSSQNWHDLLQMLDQWLAPVFVTTGSAREKTYYEEWEREFPLLNLCGQTNLRETLALMRQVDLVVTIDTSTAHLAAMAGTPRLVVLYGPTNEKQWRPPVSADTALRQVHLDLPCRPCPARTCEHRNCLRQLSPWQVMMAIRSCYQEKPGFSRFDTNGLQQQVAMYL